MAGGYRKNKSRKRRSAADSGKALFVVGGVLADWSSVTPAPSSGGRKCNRNGKSKSVLKSGNFNQGKPSGSHGGALRACGNAFGYVYADNIHQEGSLFDGGNSVGNSMDESDPVALVDSKGAQTVYISDNTPSTEVRTSQITYDYTTSFTLDDSSHRGLGFDDEDEASPSVIGPSLQMEEIKDPCSDAEEMNVDASYVNKVSTEVADDLEAKTPRKKNSGFLSIGGMKFYTEDISDEEDGEELLDGENSESSGFEDSSGSSEDEGSLYSNSDIDEEIANDYIEGIGGSINVVDLNKFAEQVYEGLDDVDTCSGIFDKTLVMLGGIDLQEASREYGMKMPRSEKKISSEKTGKHSYGLSTAVDDVTFVKDPRTLSGRKKQAARFPQSWPGEARGIKQFRKYPGEKKKHRREMITVKRRERMLHRGVDLEQINNKLEKMVMDKVDILSFQPMHTRDCSQVQRLASVYRLQSGCQGSGKKKFVTVTRTPHTCMPSYTDKLRLEKLIGADTEDADFTGAGIKPVKGDKTKTKKPSKGSGYSSTDPSSSKNKTLKTNSNFRGGSKTQKKRGNSRTGSYAAQPLSFVSSGVMQSDTVEIKPIGTKESKDIFYQSTDVDNSAIYGAFELHTMGFGSKMMAKMGFIEGRGLGKDGQGMTRPIEVTQRPKALGLGAESSGTNSATPKKEQKPVKNQTQGFASFEKHTKGFGSKMMAKMGFVEGMGLGRDSQGIVNPLVAVKFPKSRGLGSKT